MPADETHLVVHRTRVQLDCMRPVLAPSQVEGAAERGAQDDERDVAVDEEHEDAAGVSGLDIRLVAEIQAKAVNCRLKHKRKGG